MTDDHDSQEWDLRDAWISALLVSITHDTDQQDRLNPLLNQLPEHLHPVPRTGSRRRSWISLRWGLGVVAASLLCAAMVLFHSGDTSAAALAAVEQSIRVSEQDVTRHYRIQLEYLVRGRQFERAFDLYVRGNHSWALRFEGLLPGANTWLGRQGDQAWIVPARGPVRQGTGLLLGRWFKLEGQPDTPYFQVSALLARLSSGYQLQTLPTVALQVPDGQMKACLAIRGELIGTETLTRPQTIELWSSRDNGLAIRMIALWKIADDATGISRISLDFQRERPDLGVDWFSAESHFEGRRVIRQVDPLGP